jgi:polysaccharide biosynthesis protein PslH
MKVLMVTPLLPYPEAINAGPLVMHHHLAALADRHEVILASLAGPDPSEREALDGLRASGLDVRAVWRQEPGPLVLPRQRAGSPPRTPHLIPASPGSRLKQRLRRAGDWMRGKRPFRTLQFWEPQMQELLTKLLAEDTFDVIDVHDNAMGNYRYRPHIPTVLTEYEVRDVRESPHSNLPGPRWARARIGDAERRRWARYQPAVWRCFDRIQVFTRRDAEAIRTMAPDLTGRVRVNPFGVNLPKAADPRQEDGDLLVFVGGFRHPPNVDAVLWLANEIMPLIRARLPGIRLVVVGSDPPQEVQSLASPDIAVTGRVPAVEPYLERAAVVLAPVRLGGGMRLKVLQAMALGKAVVTTTVGAEGLALQHQPHPVAIANDTDAIAAATLELMALQQNRRVLGQRARAFVAEHHTWARYAERLQALYAELADGAGLR